MIIVNPNHRNGSPQAAIEPPIWCAYLASYLRKWEIQVKILDAEAKGLSVDETIEAMGGQPPILMAMGANPSASSTPKMGVVEKLKEARFALTGNNTVVSGLHPEAMGQGQYKIPINRLCELTPAWDLIDFSKYRAHNWHCLDGSDRSNYGVVYTSFGCPFKCFYCNIHTLYSGISYRKPQDVVDEIGYLVSRGVRNLKFCDELFTANKDHVNRICEMLSYRNYDLNIWAYARSNTVTPALLKNMKHAGINWLVYGFEGASLNKGDPYEAVKMTKEAGINVLGNFMFGLPNETMNDMKDTLQLAVQLQCEYVNFYVALPYPGSEWYNSLKDKPTDWSSYNQFGGNMCASHEVSNFRDRAFVQYFSNQDYQNMIKDKFGQQAVDHIKQMLLWSPRGMISYTYSVRD